MRASPIEGKAGFRYAHEEMCTLAVYFQMAEETPLLVAANRDEFYDRPSLSPDLLAREPRIWAGRDLRSGGTWLGLNEAGMIVGILNRRTDRTDPGRRSRGLLCLDLLGTSSVREAREALFNEDPTTYNPFNLICAAPNEAFVAYHAANHEERIQFESLSPGLHLLTNLNLNDPFCPRISASHRLFANLCPLLKESPSWDVAEAFRKALAEHNTAHDERDKAAPLCVHTTAYGTRSSMLLGFAAASGRFSFFYCDEPPCSGTMKELDLESGK